MSKDTRLSLEGVKLLKEWSVWMVTVELAVIAFLASGYLRDGGQLPSWGRWVAVCFGCSIAAAAWVLSALPWIVLCLDKPEFLNFYEAPISSAPILKHIRVWNMTVAQHLLFFGGLVALVFGMLGML
jgi:hypothetical protein